MIPEMTDDYSLLPPLMVSSVTSFLVSRYFLKGSSIYTIKLEKRGIVLKMGQPLLLRRIKVDEVMTKDVVTVKEDLPLTALELLIEETGHHGFPVLRNGKLIGIITVDDVLSVPLEARSNRIVKDVMKRNVHIIYPNETVEDALNKMHNNNIDRLIVVKENDHSEIIGLITHSDIIKAYNKALRKILRL